MLFAGGIDNSNIPTDAVDIYNLAEFFFSNSAAFGKVFPVVDVTVFL
jgi:hypothetical protein